MRKALRMIKAAEIVVGQAEARCVDREFQRSCLACEAVEEKCNVSQPSVAEWRVGTSHPFRLDLPALHGLVIALSCLVKLAQATTGTRTIYKCKCDRRVERRAPYAVSKRTRYSAVNYRAETRDVVTQNQLVDWSVHGADGL